MIALSVFGVITLSIFYKQIWIFTLVIATFLNCYQVFLYFKSSGLPYKSEKHYKNVKHFGWVLVAWNFGFLIKFLAVIAG